MKKHANIPIFIPHLGCPNQCVFCNQRSISGVRKFNIEEVVPQIEDALKTIGEDMDTEIAFFGGSFTGIDRDLMVKLLQIAHSYVEKGLVKSIRCSTRPDYIDDEILDILEKYSVKVIELGLQSSDDEVLRASKRGHNRLDEERACKLIVKRGFTLVGQMMIGLPGATAESEVETAKFIADVGAKGARIYPTVVFHETELCDMAKIGTYTPLSQKEAIERSEKALKVFIDRNIEVIRIGLCSSDNLMNDETYFAGPNHSALGELIVNELYFENIKELILKEKNNSYNDIILTVKVAKGAMSKAIGQKRKNKIRLMQEFPFADIKFKEDESLHGYELTTVQERKKRCI